MHYISGNFNPTEYQLNLKTHPGSTFAHLSPVSLTPVINLYLRISPQICVKIRNFLNGILIGPGKLILEQNFKLKSHVRLPLKQQ
jgi:hypothetical protein